MHRVLRRVTVICLLLLLSHMINPPIALSQSDQPKLQAISLNGIEPAPPGVEAEIMWGGWGGPPQEKCVMSAYLIAGSGFIPPLPSRDFAVRIFCISDPSKPVKIAFYQISDWDFPSAELIAVRDVYANHNGEVWLQVKVGRSAPFSFDYVGGRLIADEVGGDLIREVSWDFSACMNALTIDLKVGDKAHITPGTANNLRSEPNSKSKKLASMPGDSPIKIIDEPQCDAKGTAYWKVRYKNLEGWTAQGDLDENWIEKDKLQ
jgi:hypothetical protein